jgi:hypothetical protein
MSPSGQVQELVWGALAAQVTIVLAQLGVADVLAGRRLPAEAVARAVGADTAALRRLLRAAASLGLLGEVEDDRFELTALGYAGLAAAAGAAVVRGVPACGC